MENIWENIKNGIANIKDFVWGFFEIVSTIFEFIPSPFNTILSIALIIIISLIAVKIVRG